eukprot:5746594-Amphidinium_carterae.2
MQDQRSSSSSWTPTGANALPPNPWRSRPNSSRRFLFNSSGEGTTGKRDETQELPYVPPVHVSSSSSLPDLIDFGIFVWVKTEGKLAPLFERELNSVWGAFSKFDSKRAPVLCETSLRRLPLLVECVCDLFDCKNFERAREWNCFHAMCVAQLGLSVQVFLRMHKGIFPVIVVRAHARTKGAMMGDSSEIGVAEQLSFDRVVAALPPAGAGGARPILDLVDSGLACLLANPSRCLRAVSEWLASVPRAKIWAASLLLLKRMKYFLIMVSWC